MLIISEHKELFSPDEHPRDQRLISGVSSLCLTYELCAQCCRIAKMRPGCSSSTTFNHLHTIRWWLQLSISFGTQEEGRYWTYCTQLTFLSSVKLSSQKKLYGSVSWQISLAWFLILIWNSANLHCQRLKCLKGRTYRNAEPYPWDEWMRNDICFLVILLVIFSPFFLYRTWEQCGVDWICFLLVCDQQREMSAVSEHQSFGKEMYRRA